MRPSAGPSGRIPTQPKPVARGAVRGLKMLLADGGADRRRGRRWGWSCTSRPVMSARTIVVTGIGAVTREEVVDAAQVRLGTPLLQIDTDKVADRVAAIRRVASARVQREYPSALRVTIVERVPIVVKDYPGRAAPVRPRRRRLRDRAAATRRCPTSTSTIPGPTDPPTKAALQVLTALRPEVGGQVGRIAAPSVCLDHADAHRRPRGGVGDHRPHRGEGREAGGAADPARADLRRVEPGPADRQVARGTYSRAGDRNSRDDTSARLHGSAGAVPYRSGCAELLDITLSL